MKTLLWTLRNWFWEQFGWRVVRRYNRTLWVKLPPDVEMPPILEEWLYNARDAGRRKRLVFDLRNFD